MKKIKAYLSALPNRLLNDNEQNKIIKSYTFICLGAVSFFMTVVNLFTKEYILGASTAAFAIVCFVSLFVQTLLKKSSVVVDALFAIGVIALFTFFIVSGHPQGFSAIWIALMPPIALLFYGTKKGTLVTASMYLILIFFMWIPWGQSLISEDVLSYYSTTFRLRFPFLCIGSYVLALVLELIKDLSFKELTRVNEINKSMSTHDPLTGLLNRTGMRIIQKEELKTAENQKIYFSIIDIDKFKEINDNFSHLMGDDILKQISRLMESSLPGHVCRYGGDEFATFTLENEFDLKKFKDFVDLVANYKFIYEGRVAPVTVSIGIFEATVDEVIKDKDSCLQRADEALYISKNNGKNQVTVYKKK